MNTVDTTINLLFIVAGAFGLGTVFGSILRFDWRIIDEPRTIETVVWYKRGEER